MRISKTVRTSFLRRILVGAIILSPTVAAAQPTTPTLTCANMTVQTSGGGTVRYMRIYPANSNSYTPPTDQSPTISLPISNFVFNNSSSNPSILADATTDVVVNLTFDKPGDNYNYSINNLSNTSGHLVTFQGGTAPAGNTVTLICPPGSNAFELTVQRINPTGAVSGGVACPGGAGTAKTLHFDRIFRVQSQGFIAYCDLPTCQSQIFQNSNYALGTVAIANVWQPGSTSKNPFLLGSDGYYYLKADGLSKHRLFVRPTNAANDNPSSLTATMNGAIDLAWTTPTGWRQVPVASPSTIGAAMDYIVSPGADDGTSISVSIPNNIATYSNASDRNVPNLIPTSASRALKTTTNLNTNGTTFGFSITDDGTNYNVSQSSGTCSTNDFNYTWYKGTPNSSYGSPTSANEYGLPTSVVRASTSGASGGASIAKSNYASGDNIYCVIEKNSSSTCSFFSTPRPFTDMVSIINTTPTERVRNTTNTPKQPVKSDLSPKLLTVFPNPPQGELTIENSGFEGNPWSVQVVSPEGKVVKVLNAKEASVSMKTDMLPPGVYHISSEDKHIQGTTFVILK